MTTEAANTIVRDVLLSCHHGSDCNQYDGGPHRWDAISTARAVLEALAAKGLLAPHPSTDRDEEPARPSSEGQSWARRATWRIGNHGIHVYAGDVPVATFHTSVDAAAAVEAYNGHGRPVRYWRERATGLQRDKTRLWEVVHTASATIGRATAAKDTLARLRDASKADADAGHRGAAAYFDAYENAERLLHEALEVPTEPVPELEREPDPPTPVGAEPEPTQWSVQHSDCPICARLALRT